MYRYRAVDDAGNAVTGTMEDQSAHRVARRLQERGLTVTSVEEMHRERRLLRTSRQLTWDELHLFTLQLASVARSGLPVAPALKALSKDLRSPRLKAVLERLHHDLDRGLSLDEAINNQHEHFPRLFAGVMLAAERTGNLAGVLQLLCAYTGRMVDMRNTIGAGMAYPVMVLVAAAALTGFLLMKVVPVFSDIFKEFGGELPWITHFCIRVGDFVAVHWVDVLIVIACATIFLRVLLWSLWRRESGRAWLDWVTQHLPLMGHLKYTMAVSRFARSLGLLLQARVPVLESLELAAAVSGRPQLQRAVEEAVLEVAGGERIADALSHTGFFSHQYCWLLSTGEERGETPHYEAPSYKPGLYYRRRWKKRWRGPFYVRTSRWRRATRRRSRNRAGPHCTANALLGRCRALRGLWGHPRGGPPEPDGPRGRRRHVPDRTLPNLRAARGGTRLHRGPAATRRRGAHFAGVPTAPG